MPEYELLDVVRESGVFDSEEEADRTIRATLAALAECVSAGERRDIAQRLPEHYASRLRESAGTDSRPLDLDAFVEHVRVEAGVDRPREKVRAVLAGLTEVVGEDEIADARAQLPPAYGELFEPATVEPGTTFVDLVAEEGGFDHGTAETAARETLDLLGDRLSAGEAADVAPYLRGEAGGWLSRTATHEAEDIPADEFVSRVATRADVPEDRAREFVGAVGDALAETVPEEERQRAEAQLPEQYASVLNLE